MSYSRSLFGFAALVCLTICSSCAYTGDPKPVTSEYLRVFSGGFGYASKTHAWTMFVYVEPIRQAPNGGPLYMKATFENPQPGSRALVARGDSSQATSIGVKLETMPVKGMQDRKAYSVTVRAYADKACTKPLDALTQVMVYHDVGDPEAILHGGSPPRGMRVATPAGAGR